MKRLFKNLEFNIEEIIFLAIIILNVLDAFEIIGSDLDYIKKIISWAALGFLLYKVKLSNLFVGTDDNRLDITLIFAYFLLTIKDLISYAAVELKQSSVFLKDFFLILVQHGATIETWGIYIGLIVLFYVSLRLSFKKIKNPSIAYLIHAKETKPENVKGFFGRLFIIYLIVLAFFLIFFNLIMEWLAIAIDAPLLMIGLCVYLYFIIKHKEKFSQINFLKKFGNYGNNLYKNILENIRYKKTFFRTISAMIILHVITDTYTFVWPYLLGFGDSLYMGLLSQTHLSMFNLISSQLSGLSFIEASSLIIIYLGNIVALLFFLLFPVYMWFVFYKNKKIQAKKIQLSILVSSLVMFFLAPTFKIRALFNEKLFGVDIISQQSFAVMNFSSIVVLALAVGLFIELYSASLKHEKWVIWGLIFLSQAVLVIYMSLYLFSVSSFYIFTIQQLYFMSSFVLLIFFAILFVITICFYLFGVGYFVITTLKHFKTHIKFEKTLSKK